MNKIKFDLNITRSHSRGNYFVDFMIFIAAKKLLELMIQEGNLNKKYKISDSNL